MEDIRFRSGNNILELAIISAIGDRSEQQDSFGHSLRDGECLAVVCDGMGGHSDGGSAGGIAADRIVQYYCDSYPSNNNDEVIRRALHDADLEINGRIEGEGKQGVSGTTVVAVYIKGKTMWWYSVGDSRAYLFRRNEVAQLTKDHTYKNYLDQQLKAGSIDKEKYDEEIVRGGKLINYVGVGKLSMIDHNNTPFELHSGDVIMLVSDGIYRHITAREMSEMINKNNDISVCLDAIVREVNVNATSRNRKRDNMTAVMLKIR